MSDLVFSVAVITYNQEKYISKTLDSIILQEHNYSYEIVIGDDFSTDGTKKIIEEYVKKYPEIIKPLYNEKNFGVIRNYFNVIGHCSGKYIMECAGDDWWLLGKVAKQIKFMEENESVGMCYGKARVWNERTQKYEKKSCGGIRELFDDLLIYNNIPAVTVCFRNEVFRRYIKEIKPYKQEWDMEDYPAWIWFSKESKIKFLKEDFACYRLLENSVSHSESLEKQIKFERNISNIKNFYRLKYGYSIENFNEEECRNQILYRRVINSYDTSLSKYLRKELKKKKSLRNYIKAFLISNRLLALLGKLILK